MLLWIPGAHQAYSPRCFQLKHPSAFPKKARDLPVCFGFQSPFIEGFRASRATPGSSRMLSSIKHLCFYRCGTALYEPLLERLPLTPVSNSISSVSTRDALTPASLPQHTMSILECQTTPKDASASKAWRFLRSWAGASLFIQLLINTISPSWELGAAGHATLSPPRSISKD